MKYNVIHKTVVRFSRILITVFLFSCAGTDITTKQHFNDLLNELAEDYNFSGSILIGDSSEVIYSNAFGMANYEHKNPSRINTIYNLASLSKHITAIATVKLFEERKINFTDKLSNFSIDLPFADSITIHHLLTHSTGLPNYNNFEDYKEFSKKNSSIDETICWVKNNLANFEFNDNFSYSNTNYLLLAKIIEIKSGLDFSTYIERHIIKPADMIITTTESRTSLIDNRAAGYYYHYDELFNADYYDYSFKAGSASINSSVGDMYKLYQNLLAGKIIKRNNLKYIFTNYGDGYGYGLGRCYCYDYIHFEHDGATNGVRNYVAYYFNPSKYLVILSNIRNNNFNNFKSDVKKLILSYNSK